MSALASIEAIDRSRLRSLTTRESESLEQAASTDVSLQRYLEENPLVIRKIRSRAVPRVALSAAAGGVAGYVLASMIKEVGVLFLKINPVASVRWG